MTSPADSDPKTLAGRVADLYLETQGLAYASVAPDLRVIQTSPNFQAVTGHADTPSEGALLADLLWEFVGAEASLQGVLAGQLPAFRIDHIVRELPDGSAGYLSFRVVPLDAQSPSQGLLLLVEDTTSEAELQQSLTQDRNELRLVQRELAEANRELQRLNRLKSLFLSMAAHDLRTPLTSIFGFASLMLAQGPDLSSNQVRFLRNIADQSERLNQLITDLLDLDRIEQGLLTVTPDRRELKGLIQEVVQSADAYAKGRQITITTDLPEQPLPIWADPEAIWRILYNLLGNAIKYSPEGGRVLLRAREQEDESVIQVIDNGQGMSEEQIKKLFQLYYRTEQAEASRVAGTGIGLFVVKSLVDAHQGEIEVTSRPGQGTTFTVRLPIVGEEADAFDQE